MSHGPSLRNTIILGKPASGKTTQIIKMLKDLLKQHPNLRIGAIEQSPEIKTAVPEVASFHLPSKDFDLIILDDYSATNNPEMLADSSVPMWIEATDTSYNEIQSIFIKEAVNALNENGIFGPDNDPPQIIHMDSFVPR